jgi:hypothetical protein
VERSRVLVPLELEGNPKKKMRVQKAEDRGGIGSASLGTGFSQREAEDAIIMGEDVVSVDSIDSRLSIAGS